MLIKKVYSIPNKLPKGNLPGKILKHCEAYKNKQALFASKFAWLCLGKYIDLKKVKFNKNGKPFLALNKKYFSLSHSFNKVAIAISDKPVGIDIESVMPISIVRVLAKRLLNEKELNEYFRARNPMVWFCKYWTQHEAYIKLTGDKVTFESFKQRIECSVKTQQIQGADKRIYFVSVAQKK